MKDDTGGRRFWPVAVGRIDLEALRRDRDQIWAESVVRFRADAPWHLETPELVRLAEAEQAERLDTDVWHDRIADYAEDHKHEAIRTDSILIGALHMKVERWTQSDKLRVGRVMRLLGWTYKWTRAHGRLWVPPNWDGESVGKVEVLDDRAPF